MTRNRAIEILEMFLYKQCSLSRTTFAYTDNEIWDAVNMAREALAGKPTGKWVKRDFLNQRAQYICSLCGRNGNDYDNYCPNCGAKMENGEE